MSTESEFSQSIGVRNPYVLAEFELGRRIDWNEEDTKQVFERAFRQPYETLFDPENDSPLYEGLGLNRDGGGPIADGGFSRVVWRDVFQFLNGYPTYSEPVQGKAGDCYLIAALSAIAWTVPDHLFERVTWIEEGTPDYVRFTFTEDRGQGDDVMVEVTQRIPLNPDRETIFARSTDPTEAWPGVIEKAYAKWKTGTDGDKPLIEQISTGHSGTALGELLGVEPTVKFTARNSTDALRKFVRETTDPDANVPDDPMVAQTYISANNSPHDVSYDGANVVAAHAYTLLGYQVRDGTPYVFLRNPWNRTEDDDGVDGWWNVKRGDSLSAIELTSTNGVFALPFGQFEKHFRYMAKAAP